MFCGKCGTRNSDLSKFCRECGARLPDRPRPVLSEEQFADLRTPEPPRKVDRARVALLLERAFALRREGRVDEAVRACQEAIALDPESTSAHSLLAVFYEEMGQLDEAISHLQRVLELNPHSVADRENLARLLGQPASALAPAATEPPVAQGVNKPLMLAVATALVVLAVAGSWVGHLLREPVGQATQTVPVAQRSAPPAETPAATSGTWTPPSSSQTVALGTEPQFPSAAAPTRSAPETAQPAAPRATPPQQRVGAQRSRAGASSQPPIGTAEEPVMPLPLPESPPASAGPPAVFVPTQPVPSRARQPAALSPSSAAGLPSASITLEPTFTPAAPSTQSGASGAMPSGESLPSAVPERAVPSTDYERAGIEAVAGGRYESAVENLQKALSSARSPHERGRIQQHIAYAYQRLGRRAEAESAYREAIAQYQQQLAEGTNADLARAGIRASEMGLRSLGP